MEFADMLVLSRRKNETIRVGDNVVVTVTAIRGDKVRIGITAPHFLKILRGELPLEVTSEQSQDDVTAVDETPTTTAAGETDSGAAA